MLRQVVEIVVGEVGQPTAVTTLAHLMRCIDLAESCLRANDTGKLRIGLQMALGMPDYVTTFGSRLRLTRVHFYFASIAPRLQWWDPQSVHGSGTISGTHGRLSE